MPALRVPNESGIIIYWIISVKCVRGHENENEPKRAKSVSQWRAYIACAPFKNNSQNNLIVGAAAGAAAVAVLFHSHNTYYEIPNLLTD